MKKLLFILSIFLLTSCSSQVVLDESKRADATTVALQNVAKADSTCYHVVFEDSKMTVLDKDYIVIAKGESLTSGKKVAIATLMTVTSFMLGLIMPKIR